MPPHHDPARRLIVTTMRDEGPFILEWLAYHRAIGFTDFLVFSNDCADGTDAMLDRLAQLGVLVHLPNPRRGKKTVQWRALNRASRHPLTKQAGWVLASDVDEFLCIHTGAGRLDDLFAACPDAGGFAIPWRMFGSAGRVDFIDAPVTEQFTRCAPEALIWPWRAVQFKTLFRNSDAITGLGVHRPEGLGHAVDGNGVQAALPPGTVAATPAPRYGMAQINHYALGSAQNFLVKAARGRPNRSDEPIGLDYWIDRNLNDVEDRRILRHAPAVRDQIAGWMGDPALGDLHRASVAWRQARIAALMRESDPFYCFARISQMGSTRLLPMAAQVAMLRGLMAMRAAQAARKRAGHDAP